MFSEIDAIKETTWLMHEELLELIQTQSDVSTTSDRSSVCAQFTACSSPLSVRKVYLGPNDSKHRYCTLSIDIIFLTLSCKFKFIFNVALKAQDLSWS
jgi:hypothetical protein